VNLPFGISLGVFLFSSYMLSKHSGSTGNIPSYENTRREELGLPQHQHRSFEGLSFPPLWMGVWVVSGVFALLALFAG
jgi:hypothetical protein